MTEGPDIPDEVAIAALETVLKPLGMKLAHYMPASKAAAIEAMRSVLSSVQQRERDKHADLRAALAVEGTSLGFPDARASAQKNTGAPESRRQEI